MKSRTNYLLKRLYILFISAILTSVVFVILINVKTNPSKTERISFFIGASDCNTSSLKKEIVKNKPNKIKQINLNFNYVNSSTFSYVYNTVKSEMDFYILPYSFIKDGSDSFYLNFANIKTSYINEYLKSNLDFYEYNGDFKAIKVYDNEKEVGFASNFITYVNDNYHDDYYLLCNYKSPNIGELNNSKTSFALDIIKTLINL